MPKSMRIRVDQGELLPVKPDVVQRSDVGPGGARGLWDGFGKLVISVGERDVMIIMVCEDSSGEAVVRAIVPDDIPSVARNDMRGDHVDANLERAGLIEPDSTSRDRGWIKE